MSEQYRCSECGHFVEILDDAICDVCNIGKMQHLRYTKGGDGSHWEGCAEVHWDCRIAQLENAMRMLDDKLLVYPVGYKEYNELVKMVKKVLRLDDFVGDSDHEHDDRIL